MEGPQLCHASVLFSLTTAARMLYYASIDMPCILIPCFVDMQNRADGRPDEPPSPQVTHDDHILLQQRAAAVAIPRSIAAAPATALVPGQWPASSAPASWARHRCRTGHRLRPRPHPQRAHSPAAGQQAPAGGTVAAAAAARRGRPVTTQPQYDISTNACALIIHSTGWV